MKKHTIELRSAPRLPRELRTLGRFVLLCIWISSATDGRVNAGDAPMLHQSKVIELPNVEGRIDDMAFDAKSGRLFVAALGNNSVDVIDTRAGKGIRSISGLREPQGISLAGNSGSLYIANAADGSCRIFDDKTFTLVRSIDLKEDADNVRFDAASNRIYVGYGDGALAVIDAEHGAHLSDIKLPAHPESFQLEKQGRRIFVNLPSARGVVAVIDRDKGVVLQTWSLRDAKSNFPMALDEAHHRLFIGCRNPAKLLVLDTSDGKPVASVNCVGDTDDVWYDASRKRIYVSGGEGAVTVIQQADADHYSNASRVPTAPGARTSLFDPENDALYVAVPHRGNQKAELRVFTAR